MCSPWCMLIFDITLTLTEELGVKLCIERHTASGQPFESVYLGSQDFAHRRLVNPCRRAWQLVDALGLSSVPGQQQYTP
mgnify:CR=1 FL=1